MALIISGFCISSCKKQEMEEPVVSFVQPITGAKYDVSSRIVLEANVADQSNLLSVFWYLEGPDGDTVYLRPANGATNSTYNVGERFHIVQNFIHGTSYFSTGTFKWHVVVANKFTTIDKVRIFQVGDETSIVPSFSVAQVVNSSGRINVSLYNGNLQPMKNYQVKSQAYLRADKVSSLAGNIYYYNSSSANVGLWNGYSGEEQTTLLSSTRNTPDFFSDDELYLSNFGFSPSIARYGKQGNHLGNITNRYGKSLHILKLGETIFSVEEEALGGKRRLVTYNATTGSYLSNSDIPSNLPVYGLFSFNDPNRVYFMTRDPIYSSRTAFWYTDRYLNTMSQLSVVLQGRVVNQNPVMISNSEAWIFSNAGLYSYKTGDRLLQQSINSSGNLRNVNSYEYNEKAKTLRYSDNIRHYFYSYSSRNEIGKLIANGAVVFLED
tara:strand:- start:2938 stop:4248 length:1311 start_codon:yes stop_codon:yes gene_type:complete